MIVPIEFEFETKKERDACYVDMIEDQERPKELEIWKVDDLIIKGEIKIERPL